VLPVPPVLTAWRFFRVPFAERSKTTTELPAGSFVCVYTAPTGAGLGFAVLAPATAAVSTNKHKKHKPAATPASASLDPAVR